MLLVLVSCAAPTKAQQNTSAQHRPPAATAPQSVPSPEIVLGFRPGDDRKLASWKNVVDYFERLDAVSDRVKFEELGKTTMGKPFVMATISAPENLARLGEYRKIQQQLADPRKPEANTDRKAAQLIARGKTIVLITCGVHSNEVGSYLSSMLIAHRLASSDEPQVQKILRETIVLLVPSLNPDGVDIIKDWYDKTLGTPYEGTEPPVLYHKYVGHDDNRDWYAFTQVETRLTVDRIHNVWHPQIVHDIHQQGANGARLFLPPYMEPVEPNVPQQIVEGYTELGQAIAAEMRAAGFQGITTGTTYDAWTPARAYSHYHGGVRILSETASARLATPVTVSFAELRGGIGYDAKKETAKFSPVWRGGEWHLRDITNYMTAAAFSLMNHAAENRERWLRRFYEIGKEAVRPRRKGEMSAYLLPPSADPCDDMLNDVLYRGGVRVELAPKFNFEGVAYPKDTRVIRMDQPYGGFAKALLEAQQYPNLRDTEGQPVQPYDVTAHTLSLLAGVKVKAVKAPFSFPRLGPGMAYLCDHDVAVHVSQAAIYISHVPSMDAGWTQWVFKEKQLELAPLNDERIRNGNLYAPDVKFDPSRFKSIIIPDQSPRTILEGHRKGSMPDELTGGLGAEGVKALREFVEQGGTLIFFNRASNFAIEQFKLPVRDVTNGLKRTEFYAPGSILRTELDTKHPIARGMARESIAWVESSPVFEIDEREAARVRVIARYPADTDPLLSGWLLGGERMRGKAALVEVTMGKGRVYLFGFRPQYRGQSLATYPLLFNALGK
jgi:hypothetical protein